MNRFSEVKLSAWTWVRNSRKNTIFFLLLIGLLLYLFIVLFFGLLYYKSESIGVRGETIVIEYFDAFYFSFVSFITIGYGDLYPITDCGRKILFLETICSVVFNGAFPSILIYFALKRPNSILLASKIIVGSNKDGKYTLKVRIGNRGDHFVNCLITFKVFLYTSGVRTTYSLNKKSYSMIESNTVLVCPIMLENSKNEKLLTKLQSLFKDENEKLTLRVSLTGTDAGTGDSLTFVNYYSQKDILFSHKYQLVESWTDDNILSLKWGNFNKTSINEDDKLEDFLNIKVS